MAAPNLNASPPVYGKTAYLNLANTNETNLLVNAASSGKAMRVTSLILVNTDGEANVDATVKLYSAASGGTAYPVVSTVTIPFDSTVSPLGRDLSIYLEEDRRLTVQASAANDLTVICSYEEAG
jgi:hypothetical protein